MNSSILWNGFEIKKGLVKTDTGNIPYILYTPEISRQSLNIAIHGENSSKDEWLCFNSRSKLGNLLKESIRMNSPFLALDLYGHGEWHSDDRTLDPGNMSEIQEEEFYMKSINGLNSAIDQIILEEDLTQNPISLTGYSKGCNIILNIELQKEISKMILISPYNSNIKTKCQNFLIFRGKDDLFVADGEFDLLRDNINGNVNVELYDTNHEVPESWINRAKEFIYS